MTAVAGTCTLTKLARAICVVNGRSTRTRRIETAGIAAIASVESIARACYDGTFAAIGSSVDGYCVYRLGWMKERE